MNLLQMSASGGVLVLAVAFLRLFTLRVLPKRTFLVLWAIVLIRLLIPFAPIFRVSLPVPDFSAEREKRVESAVNAVSPAVRNAALAPSPRAQFDGHATENPFPAYRPQTRTQPQNVAYWLRIIWAAGACIVGAFFVIVYATGYRKFRQAFPVERDAARVWMKTHPLKRKFAIKSFGGLDSPMTYGILRPVILVPGAASWWDRPEARFALEHEYIHMRRFDAAFKFALALALTLHWFNPTVWALYALANRDMELSCDEEALDRLGGTERAAYARALLAEEERRRTPSPFAAFGTNATRERIVEIMKYRKKSPFSVIAAVLLTLTLAACSVAGPTNGTSGTSATTEGKTSGTSAATGSEGVVNAGFRLSVPPEYKDLLVIETPQNDPNGVLFSVSEKASIEAANAQGDDYDGAGWLFSVARISEDAFHEAICYDMSGEEVFAKNTDGQYYMYCHPTDVRLVREDYADKESIDQWTALNEWAATAPDTFLAENPGLTAEKRGNTALDMYLARVAYMDGVNYTVSATEYGPMDGSGFDASSYAESLTNGVTFEPADDSETPDGEYIVLSFPDDDIRFDFFRAEGKEHYIRQVWSGDNETLYRAVFENGDHASDTCNIMSEWYDALVTVNGGWALDASGFTGEEFAGEWQDSYSQRAVLHIASSLEMNEMDVSAPGVYSVA
ncbi:MAG: hypothetical protein IJQ81_16435, partial [Oscillibacter sp.]|nr:hypothetical protein [Oscillibacter sp.]